MEILTFLLVLTLFIIVLIQNSGINDKISTILQEIEWLKYKLNSLEQQPIKREKVPEPVPAPVPAQKPEKPVMPAEEITLKAAPDKVEERIISEVKPTPTSVKSPPVAEIAPTPQPAKPKKTKAPGDWEKFIGENLISKIGIIILVLGVGYFVKYAIDKNWINEYGRVAIGVLTGGGLIAVAHWIRKNYKTFSSLLTGGGIAVLYVTIAIAFHEYHIFSQTVAFILLIIITIFSVILSLIYDKKELAIFSQFGGYAAPFMVSTGEGNYIVLFTYLLILNAGLIALAWFKRWQVVNIIAYVFTILLYCGWLTNTFYFGNNPPYMGALIFASLFYLVFFLVNVLNNIRQRQVFKGIEIAMILSNNLFYFLAGLVILANYQNGLYKGLFTVLVGIYNFGWLLFLYRKKQIDKTLIYLLVGLVMSYISLAIPIQLNGHSITLFWTAEMVILLWLWRVSGINLLKTGHLLILVLVLISLTMDWLNLYEYSTKPLSIIINQAFVTGLVVIAGLAANFYFLKKEKEETFVYPLISAEQYRLLTTFLLFALTYLVLFLELQYQLNQYYPIAALRYTIYGVFNFAYWLVALLIIHRLKRIKTLEVFFYISLGGLVVYATYYLSMVLYVRDAYFFDKSVSLGGFLFHYWTYPIIAVILWLINKYKKEFLERTEFWNRAHLWIITIFWVIVASVEMNNIVLLSSGITNPDATNDILQMNHKVGYPILWGVIAFLLIVIGLQKKIMDYRMLALCLFALIILKLFLFDVWDMSEGGRIAAFVFLGIVLLVVSFLYQKLKRFIMEESEQKPEKNEN